MIPGLCNRPATEIFAPAGRPNKSAVTPCVVICLHDIQGTPHKRSYPVSWKTEVTNGSGLWTANRLRFSDQEEAAAYVRDFKNRTSWVTDTKVTWCDCPATHRYVNGELLKKVELFVQASPEESHS
jgi:hypothetical protein